MALEKKTKRPQSLTQINCARESLKPENGKNQYKSRNSKPVSWFKI